MTQLRTHIFLNIERRSLAIYFFLFSFWIHFSDIRLTDLGFKALKKKMFYLFISYNVSQRRPNINRSRMCAVGFGNHGVTSDVMHKKNFICHLLEDSTQEEEKHERQKAITGLILFVLFVDTGE